MLGLVVLAVGSFENIYFVKVSKTWNCRQVLADSKGTTSHPSHFMRPYFNVFFPKLWFLFGPQDPRKAMSFIKNSCTRQYIEIIFSLFCYHRLLRSSSGSNVAVTYRWQVTGDMQHVTCDMLQIIHDIFCLFCPFVSFAIGAIIRTCQESQCLCMRDFWNTIHCAKLPNRFF